MKETRLLRGITKVIWFQEMRVLQASKRSPFDWCTISNLSHRPFCVCCPLICRTEVSTILWSIYLFRTSFQPPFQENWSRVAFAHVAHHLGNHSYTARWSACRGGLSHLKCVHFICFRICNIVRRSHHCEGLLGLVEGPSVPGTVLYLSSFYTREELSLR